MKRKGGQGSVKKERELGNTTKHELSSCPAGINGRGKQASRLREERQRGGRGQKNKHTTEPELVHKTSQVNPKNGTEKSPNKDPRTREQRWR